MTRAKQSLAHVTLDELEQTLPLPPDEKLLPLEDGEEYQYFLQALNTGLEELPEDDEEDVDFTLDELDGLLGPIDSDAEDNLAHAEAEPRQASAQSQPAEKRLRRNAASQEQQRRLPMIMPNEELGVPACDFMGQDQQLTAPLAEGDGSPAPPVRQRPPLTGDLWPQEPDLSPRGFDAEQIKQLYCQLSHHCQLLIQTYALTDCNSSHQDTAAQLSDLLNDYQEHSKHLLEEGSSASGQGKQYDLPYSLEILGLDPVAQPDTQHQQAEPTSPPAVPPFADAESPPLAEVTSQSHQTHASERQQQNNPASAEEGTEADVRGQDVVVAWHPVADFPVHSITEVACVKLLPEFLQDMAQVAVASEPAGAEGVQGSKDKRMPAPTVPAEVKQAVAIFKPYFDPDLFPRFQALPPQMIWTQAEDELVAAGMYRYGLDLDLISRHLMPVKTVKEIQTRQKNRCHRVEGNCLRTAREHVTRPLEPSEVAIITRAMGCMEKSVRLQRHLERLHGLRDSSQDYRTEITNRWRLLPCIPHLKLQSRSGMMLRQMYEEVVHNKPKTSHVGDPLGGKRPNATKPKPAKTMVRSSFLTQPACGYQEGPKQHGGSRKIVLQPPVFLLFDDPANSQATEEDERLVAGRVAKIRKPELPQTSRRRPDDITLSPSARNFLAVAHQADQAVADSYSAANAESVEPGQAHGQQESVAEADNKGSTLEDDYRGAQHQEPMDQDALLDPPVTEATNPTDDCLQSPGAFLSDSSEDEDFSPSEFEQDEMSQPDSSSSEEDAFEMDEMSQPESSSEDEPARKRAPPSQPSSAVQMAQSKSKSSRLRPVSERQLARLGLPKAAQPASDGVTRQQRTVGEQPGQRHASNAAQQAAKQASLGASRSKAGKRQASADPSPGKPAKRQALVSTTPSKAAKRKTSADASPSSRPQNAPQQQQQEPHEQEAPVSFRKRPRKPSRPQCSGPSVFIQAPSPDANKGRLINQGSPSGVRQLRPRHNVAGKWAPKGSRPQGHTDGAQFEAAPSEQSPPQKNATRGKRSSKAAGSLSESQPGGTVEDSAVAAALPDNMLFVNGALTTWTDTADRAIMLACLVQAQGHPSPEAFDDLVRQ
ncbi:hypothetical protein WJX82_001301 [Trebouxia sp. C0006]